MKYVFVVVWSMIRLPVLPHLFILFFLNNINFKSFFFCVSLTFQTQKWQHLENFSIVNHFLYKLVIKIKKKKNRTIKSINDDDEMSIKNHINISISVNIYQNYSTKTKRETFLFYVATINGKERERESEREKMMSAQQTFILLLTSLSLFL